MPSNDSVSSILCDQFEMLSSLIESDSCEGSVDPPLPTKAAFKKCPNTKKAFITTQLMAQLFNIMIQSGCELDREHKINCNRIVSLIHTCETVEQVNALKQLKMFDVRDEEE
tara:strand:+ start:768 stop:1103 length:336 start_codon:yes stop_codon:yes gene_type:complete